MIFLLWRRENGLKVAVRKLGVSPDMLTVVWKDYTQFMWIERGGERIGVYMLEVQRARDNKSYEFSTRARLRLDAFNQKIPVQLDVSVLLNELFEMQTFQGRLDAAGEIVSVDALTEGKDLYYQLKGPEFLVQGGGTASRIALQEPVMLADAIRPVVTQSGRLRVGSKWSAMASDPISGQFSVPVRVEVVAWEGIEIEGEKFDAYRVTETAGETVTTSWYDSDGEVLKTDLGNGLVMLRADREKVFAQYKELSVPPNFPEINREAVRQAAGQEASAQGQPHLSWMPKL